MEGGEDVHNNNEDIDDFYVVDSWSEKSSRPDIKFNSVGNNILSGKDKLSCRKPTEGEIDEFLENLKQSKSKHRTSGLEDSICNSFDSGKQCGNFIKTPEGNSRHKLHVKNQADKQFPQPVKAFKHSTVSYKPGEILTKTFFRESSFNDLSKSINNNQKINILSSDSFHVSIDRNEDSGGGFSDEKGSQCTNGPCKSTIMESSSRHLGGRSRSPYTNSASRHHPVRDNMRFPPREGGRNHSHIDSLRNDRNFFQDKRHYEGIRRNRRSRSRSRERKNYRRQSYERRSSLSLSPPPKRESGNQSSMEPRSMPSYYQSSGAPIPPDPSFMNPNPNPNFGFSTSGPVQYPINPASSNTSYGRYPGYNVPANNLFNSDPTQPQSFQPQMPQNFPENQYPNPPQNYNLYNPVMQSNPPNPVSYPATWNQSSTGFNQNYSVPTLSSTDAVMYPHLKIGQSRVDSFKNSHRETLNSSSPLRQSRSSLEKRMHSTSRSPEPRKHKRKASKRYSRSPSLDRKFDDNNKRYARHSKSPVKSFRYDSKNPKVIIDPSRIPTPPPPPIVGSYKNNNSIKSIELRAKNVDRRSDVNPLSDFLNKENVSLSCLLEAVMETSGQGKSQLSDPKVKKEIISNCESKIQRLYKRRMTGLGAFIPDPIKSSRVITDVSPLVIVYSPFTYNCEEDNNEWHCPDIIVPEMKMKKNVKVPVNDFVTSQTEFEAVDRSLKTNIENPTVIPTLSNNQSLLESNWNAKKPENVSQHIFPNAFDNNQQNMFPSHQGPQTWSNPVQSQNPYTGQSPMPGSTNEYSTLGPTPYIPPSYSFPHRPPGPQFMPQHGYPPQPEMLNYPTRMDYPPMHHFPNQNLNHPGMFSAPQPDSNRNNYQYKADETHKLRKSKNMVNDNLILLSRNPKAHSDAAQKDKKERNQNNVSKDIFRDDKDKMSTDDSKDKLLKKVRRSRKSSEHDHGFNDLQGTKESKDKFYNKLNYAEMLDDTQLDSVHDYQLTNLRERIETCLAEGKSSPGHSRHRSSDRREGDREKDRHKDKDRGRDKIRVSDRSRKDSMEGERKWHGRSPLRDERKKCRSVEGHSNHEHRKSREPSDKKDHCKVSGRDDVIEILSDEDHYKQKLLGSCATEGSMDPDDHLKQSEKTLQSQIFDSLGPEIRKIQEKSDLYKSIIDTLDKGDKAYKRLYSFRNHALMKSDKDNRMKMVIPRDNLKEVVLLIHKSFHHVQGEELSRLLKNISYPYMLYIPKCVSKVMSECPMCIEEKKKNDEALIDPKSDRIERKSDKKNNRSLKDRDRDRDRKNSTDRYKRASKDKSSSSSSKGRRDYLRSGREKDKKDSNASDGRPSGYEKATKIKKPSAPSCAMSNKVSPDYQCHKEKSDLQIDVKSTEPLGGLNDKALEFKHISDGVNDVSEEKSSIPEGFNQQLLSGLDKKNNEKISADSKNDAEDKDRDPEIESSDLVTKTEIKSSDIVSKPETESSITVTKPELESTDPFTKPDTESSDAVTKSGMESFNTLEKTELESSDAITISEETLNTPTLSDMEISNTVTKTEMKSSDQISIPQNHKELVNSISEASYFLKEDSIDTNLKPSVSSSNTDFDEMSKQSVIKHKLNSQIKLGEESKENNFKEEKVSLDQKVNDIDSKATPKLDFKGRVRQVQMLSDECKNVIKALESKDDTIADPSYIIKGGMLCKKDTTGNTIEIKIVVPSDEVEKVVSIVHTMSAVHTPPTKVVAFFSKHFTMVENLDLKVNEIVANCSYCKLKSS